MAFLESGADGRESFPPQNYNALNFKCLEHYKCMVIHIRGKLDPMFVTPLVAGIC